MYGRFTHTLQANQNLIVILSQEISLSLSGILFFFFDQVQVKFSQLQNIPT